MAVLTAPKVFAPGSFLFPHGAASIPKALYNRFRHWNTGQDSIYSALGNLYAAKKASRSSSGSRGDNIEGVGGTRDTAAEPDHVNRRLGFQPGHPEYVHDLTQVMDKTSKAASLMHTAQQPSSSALEFTHSQPKLDASLIPLEVAKMSMNNPSPEDAALKDSHSKSGGNWAFSKSVSASVSGTFVDFWQPSLGGLLFTGQSEHVTKGTNSIFTLYNIMMGQRPEKAPFHPDSSVSDIMLQLQGYIHSLSVLPQHSKEPAATSSGTTARILSRKTTTSIPSTDSSPMKASSASDKHDEIAQIADEKDGGDGKLGVIDNDDNNDGDDDNDNDNVQKPHNHQRHPHKAGRVSHTLLLSYILQDDDVAMVIAFVLSVGICLSTGSLMVFHLYLGEQSSMHTHPPSCLSHHG